MTVVTGVVTVAAVTVGVATVTVATGVVTLTVAATAGSVALDSVDRRFVVTRAVEVESAVVGAGADPFVAAPATPTLCAEAATEFALL